MNPAVISVALIALAIVKVASAAEEPRKTPWIFYSSAGTDYLDEDVPSRKGTFLQHRGYLGSTVKPLDFAWFHGGLSTQWTQSEALEDGLTEPAALKLATGLKVYRRLLYVTAGMTLPLAETSSALKDTSGVSSLLNDYNLAAEPNVLNLNAVNVGAYIGHSFGKMHLRLGAAYYRPSSYTLFENFGVFHSDHLNYRLKMLWETPRGMHHLHFLVTQFGDEKDRRLGDSPAHAEGGVYQAFYSWKIHWGPQGFETGVGAALRGKDKNRTEITQGDFLEEEAKNSNIQRYYLHIGWVRTLGSSNPLHLQFAPQMLYQQLSSAWGYQMHFTARYQFKVAARHKLSTEAFATMGELDSYYAMGGGLKITFSFHSRSRALFPRRIADTQPE